MYMYTWTLQGVPNGWHLGVKKRNPLGFPSPPSLEGAVHVESPFPVALVRWVPHLRPVAVWRWERMRFCGSTMGCDDDGTLVTPGRYNRFQANLKSSGGNIFSQR